MLYRLTVDSISNHYLCTTTVYSCGRVLQISLQPNFSEEFSYSYLLKISSTGVSSTFPPSSCRDSFLWRRGDFSRLFPVVDTSSIFWSGSFSSILPLQRAEHWLPMIMSLVSAQSAIWKEFKCQQLPFGTSATLTNIAVLRWIINVMQYNF